MAADLDIIGTQLSIRFEVPVTATVRHVKELLQASHRLPTSRQTLRIFGAVMSDGATLASYNVRPGMLYQVELLVEPNATNPIHVTLEIPQVPFWIETVRCMETDTVARFKELAKVKVRRVRPNSFLLYHGPPMTRMDRDDHRLLSEFLVLDGSVVYVQFPFRNYATTRPAPPGNPPPPPPLARPPPPPPGAARPPRPPGPAM